MTCRSAGLQVKVFNALCANKKTWCLCLDDELTGADYAGQGFSFFSNNNDAQYYIWLDNTEADDPALAGTAVPVSINDIDSSQNIVSAIAAAIDGLADMCAGVAPFDKNCFFVKVNGYDSTADPDVSGFTNTSFNIESEGFEFDLGPIDGTDISFSIDQDTSDQVCYQTGSVVVDQTVTGINVSIDLTFKSCSDAFKKKIIGEGFGLICTDANGENHVGYGTSIVGQSALTRGNRLIFRPINAVAGDETGDIVLPLAIASVSDFSFPNESPATISVSFRALPDRLFKCETDVYHEGSHSEL